MISIKAKFTCFTQIDSHAAATANSLQSCLTLRYPINGSPPGSLVPGILQARVLEWVPIAFSVIVMRPENNLGNLLAAEVAKEHVK